MTAPPGFNQTPGSAEAPARPIQRRLYRSRTNRVFAGVCGGIAEYYGAEPRAVRLLTVVIAVFTALVPMFVLYLVAAVIRQASPRHPAKAVWSSGSSSSESGLSRSQTRHSESTGICSGQSA